MKLIRSHLILFVLLFLFAQSTEVAAGREGKGIPDFTPGGPGQSGTSTSVEFLWKKSLDVYDCEFSFEGEHIRLYHGAPRGASKGLPV